MKITLTEKQVDISEKLRNYVEENLTNSVNKYFNAPISSTVAFSKEKEIFAVEVTVHPAKNIVLKGEGHGTDPYSAFDDASGHIATRLRRHKTKLKDHKGKTGISEIAKTVVYPWLEKEDEVDIDENAPLTIAETDVNIPVCTVSEAVMYMDLENECALLFRNVANHHISMVYRRKDGNIGWVEPKNEE